MQADSLTTEEAGKLLQQLVSLFNGCVRTQDFSQCIDLFDDTAVLEYEGIPDWGPFEGKSAIARRLHDDPPDDELVVTGWKYERGRIVAQFKWRDIPEARGGTFVIVPRDRKIARLIIAFGGPDARL
jgi:hypothetical protein